MCRGCSIYIQVFANVDIYERKRFFTDRLNPLTMTNAYTLLYESGFDCYLHTNLFLTIEPEQDLHSCSWGHMAVTLLIGLFYLAKDGAPLRGFMVELQGCTIPWLAPADFRGLTCGEKAWMSHHPLIPLNHDSVLIFTRHSRSYPKISCITLLQPRLLCKGTSQRDRKSVV